MLTSCKSIGLAFDLLGRLRFAVRLAVVADLDAKISNVSPFTPIHEGMDPLGKPCAASGSVRRNPAQQRRAGKQHDHLAVICPFTLPYWQESRLNQSVWQSISTMIKTPITSVFDGRCMCRVGNDSRAGFAVDDQRQAVCERHR